MNMSFQDREEPECELVDRGRIAPHLLEHRIDQDCGGGRADRCRSTIAGRTVAGRSCFPPRCAFLGEIIGNVYRSDRVGGAPVARRASRVGDSTQTWGCGTTRRGSHPRLKSQPCSSQPSGANCAGREADSRGGVAVPLNSCEYFSLSCSNSPHAQKWSPG